MLRPDPAEAKLAIGLLGGQMPGDYAQVNGVSQNTVKTQLKQVLAKTGTHPQAELIQLLAAGFGMLSEPNRLGRQWRNNRLFAF